MTVDQNSPTWRAVRDHAIRQIDAGRDTLETVQGSVEFAQLHRGRIQAFREILALADAPLEIKEGVTVY